MGFSLIAKWLWIQYTAFMAFLTLSHYINSISRLQSIPDSTFQNEYGICGLVKTICPSLFYIPVKKTITCRNDRLLSYMAVEFHHNPVLLTPQLFLCSMLYLYIILTMQNPIKVNGACIHFISMWLCIIKIKYSEENT